MNKEQHTGHAGADTKPERAPPGEVPDKPGHRKTHSYAQDSEHKKENAHTFRRPKTLQGHQRYYGHNDGSIQRLKRKQNKER